MITLPRHTSVLIVGAGPSGLMMAAQLLRSGVQPVIIDAKQGPSGQSKALAVQARSLEIYRQLGIADKALEESEQAKGLVYNINGRQAAKFSLADMGDTQTRFPFICLYRQSKNERLLLDYLTRACCPVYWGTTLITLQQSADIVNATLQNGDVKHSLTCDYVAGADGAHSFVREQLDIPFNGDSYQHKFYLADVVIDSSLKAGLIHLYLSKNGFAGFFPLPGKGSYRIVASLPHHFEDNETLQLDEVLPSLDAVTSSAIDKVLQVNWFTIYKLHHRMAGRFGDQRCFLIGDAAHIHSPVGGQGMNTGLQDAYNLGWKMAAVVNGQIRPAILNSYADERMPVAKDLLNTTDRVFNVITSRGWFSGLLKQYIMPAALKMFGNNANLRNYFFKRISQTGINYRDSKINLQSGQVTKIKAGDRLPYLEIFDEKKQERTDIHAWCGKPGFTLITLGEIKESYLFTLAKWITRNYQGSLNFFHLPPSPGNRHVFDAFEVKPSSRKVIIVRPDMHIGYINDITDIALMDNYLQNVVGFVSPQYPAV